MDLAARRPEPSAPPLVALLDYRPPFDWEGLIGFFAARAIPGVEAVAGERWMRTVSIGGATGVVAVEPAAGGRLRLEARLSDPSVLPLVIARARRLFDLDADPAAMAARLSLDPALAPLLAARPGLRKPGAWDGFELAVRAVLGQQITVAAVRKLAGRIAQAHGAPLAEPWREEGLERIFPSPVEIAAADLTSMVTPGARARALSALGASVAADPTLVEPGRGLDASVAALRALKGIGEWTAQYIALRALGEPDAFPAADVGLMRAMAGPDGARPSAAELLARAEAWRPFRAWAAQHLWTADAARWERAQIT